VYPVCSLDDEDSQGVMDPNRFVCPRPVEFRAGFNSPPNQSSTPSDLTLHPLIEAISETGCNSLHDGFALPEHIAGLSALVYRLGQAGHRIDQRQRPCTK
jgi:hypothetical protein